MTNLKLEITTYEFYNNKWNEVLTHAFYGTSKQDILALVEAHKKTDSFFRASFTGRFEWNNDVIELKNEISDYIPI